MTTDLKGKTVDEVLSDVIEYFKQDLSRVNAWGFTNEARQPIARRLEEAQQKIVAQQTILHALKSWMPSDGMERLYAIQLRAANDGFADLAAHDAEVAAKAKAEAMEEAADLCYGFAVCGGNEHCVGYGFAASLRGKAAEYRAESSMRVEIWNPDFKCKIDRSSDCGTEDLLLFLGDRAAYVGKRHGEPIFTWTVQGLSLRKLIEKIKDAESKNKP